MKKTNSFFDLFIRKGTSHKLQKVSGLPLSETVEVFRDAYGIPHIFARSNKDAFFAQGFVHAQDRLWQMETIKRLASGTLSEIVGEESAELDHFSRLAGFPRMQRRQISALTSEQREIFGAYVEGINAFIDFAGNRLPLEFSSLNVKPDKWSINDTAGALPINAWFLQSNYLEEIIAVLARKNLDEYKWAELFPSSPGEDLPNERFFKRFADVDIGPFIPAALAFYSSLGGITGGSNSWVTAGGPRGLPLLANDPHLDSGVPQIWHFCHLDSPDFHFCGASFPGMPGIVIGRNEQVAWGLTNVMIDCCDLSILTVDPEHPTTYYVGDDAMEMEQIEENIAIRDGGSRKITSYHTIHGPVLTEVTPGVEAVVALKWYGTLPDGELQDTTLRGAMGINSAKSVRELLETGRLLATVGQNIVAADSNGSIGWYACGFIPRRKGYSGRLPADGSSPDQEWTGFVPPEENPSVFDPPEGSIAMANQKTIDSNYHYSISYSWAAPYRYERITELLTKVREGANRVTSIPDFKKMHSDVFSKRAEHYLPVILKFTYRDRAAKEGASILAVWDKKMDKESTGGLVFQVFLYRIADELLQELLGEGIRIYNMFMMLFYSALDTLFDGENAARRHTSFDGKNEAPRERNSLLGERDLEDLCETALKETVQFIETVCGKDRKQWKWGKLHRYYYKHPGAKGRIAAWLLNRGPYPAGGSAETINMANFNPMRGGNPFKQYEVTTVPSLRFITSLADQDSSLIIGHMGQSGIPGDPHYADMIKPWINVEYISLPLSRKGTEDCAVRKMTLEP